MHLYFFVRFASRLSFRSANSYRSATGNRNNNDALGVQKRIIQELPEEEEMQASCQHAFHARRATRLLTGTAETNIVHSSVVVNRLWRLRRLSLVSVNCVRACVPVEWWDLLIRLYVIITNKSALIRYIYRLPILCWLVQFSTSRFFFINIMWLFSSFLRRHKIIQFLDLLLI